MWRLSLAVPAARLIDRLANMSRDEILQVVQHFLEATDMEDGDLVDALVEKGQSKEFAEHAVAFLPIAFGRVVIVHIAQVTFTTDYQVKETKQTHSLSNEPIFVKALKLATDSYHMRLVPRKVFSAIAMRSPELLAVNKALNEGADINGASFQTLELTGYKTIGKKKWYRCIFG